jgi:putative transposase
MHLSPGGEMVWRWWGALNEKYPSVRTDAAVVMPNHFHGIIVITGDPQSGQPGQPRGVAPTGVDGDAILPGQPRGVAPTGMGGDAVVGATLRGRPNAEPQADVDGDAILPGQPSGQPRMVAPTGMGGDAVDRTPTLGQIVGWFKTMATNEYIRGVKQLGWPPFRGKVWQRNYYEHIIRNREALERIRGYIQTNPERWALDRENPQRTGLDELEFSIYGPPERWLAAFTPRSGGIRGLPRVGALAGAGAWQGLAGADGRLPT